MSELERAEFLLRRRYPDLLEMSGPFSHSVCE
jgi:hypothetical protein